MECRRRPVMEFGCLNAVDNQMWHNFSTFVISVIPLHSFLVSDVKIYILLVMFLPLVVVCEFSVTGEFSLGLISAKYVP